jgi:alpha-1,3-glucosyltransferase
MLGLTLLCLDYLAISSDVIASVFFVLSLGFKQMALYYAPAIGSYLLGKCIFLGFQDGYVLVYNIYLTLAMLILY